MSRKQYDRIHAEIEKEIKKKPYYNSISASDVATDLTPMVIEFWDEAFRAGRKDFADELHQLAEALFDD